MSVIEIKDEKTFDEKIAGDQLVIVDFFANWCGPCKRIAPEIEKLAQKHSSAVFLKVNVDKLMLIAERYEIRAMPTFLFFKNGKKVDDVVGADINKVINAITVHHLI